MNDKPNCWHLTDSKSYYLICSVEHREVRSVWWRQYLGQQSCHQIIQVGQYLAKWASCQEIFQLHWSGPWCLLLCWDWRTPWECWQWRPEDSVSSRLGLSPGQLLRPGRGVRSAGGGGGGGGDLGQRLVQGLHHQLWPRLADWRHSLLGNHHSTYQYPSTQYHCSGCCRHHAILIL